MMLRSIVFLGLAMLNACSAVQEGPEDSKAPATGPDWSLDALSPQPGPVNVGLAGTDPANLGRYLLAQGASAPALSPRGDLIAFRSSLTGRPQIWIMPSEGGMPRQITFGNGVTFFRWLPDGDELIYGADNDGNEQESYYRIRADGATETLLLPAVSGGFRSFGDISASGSIMAFASTERNGLDFDIYTADLQTGVTQQVFQGVYGFFARALSPDGQRVIVTESVGEDADKLYLLDIASGELETVSNPAVRANHGDGGFAWRADGSGFYFASNVDREFSGVFYYDLERAAFRLLVDTDHDARDIELCGSDQAYLAFTQNIDGFDTLHLLDTRSGREVPVPSLAEGRYTISCSDRSDQLLIGINGWRTPGDILIWDLSTGTVTQPYDSNYAGLDPNRFVRPVSIRMEARDGVMLQGLLYLPDAQSTQQDGLPPVIFEVHGGPTAQSVAGFDPITQYRVDRGLAVFKPNVRGSTGFGRTYATLDDREKRRDSVRDLIDMADALRADGRVDMDRAAVAGGSYGGYMVNAVLALYPENFAAGVSRYGVADWVTALQVASPALKASDRIEYGDISEPDWLAYYTENSPIRLADRIQVPVLYSHGVMDPRIDIYETELMVKTLRANGIDAPYIRIPDEGHGWRKLANRLFYYRAEAAFLEAALGGPE